MSTHKHIDRLCAAAVVLALLLTICFMNGEALGIQATPSAMGYEDRLFDTSSVHTIDIVMDDWDGFIETCENEEYTVCTVIIDGEAYKNVGIRAKGNTSLSTVSSMNSNRYSFKIEFDQYDSTKSYYGLDKLSLNNLIQDNTLMKDYLTYRMMGEFGVAAPLCSYTYITVNGEDWGLYLAVEGVEDSFLQRNYGADHGELYKPDSMSFGGGRGNGRDFNMEDFMNSSDETFPETTTPTTPGGGRGGQGGMAHPSGDAIPEDFDPSSMTGGDFELPEDFDFSSITEGNRGNAGAMGGMGGMGSSDVKLQYTDDDPNSYSSIFDNAKTNITDADQTRLIAALKDLTNGENIESVVNIDEVLRYFVVHNFVVNGDSYTGSMIHNYYLYEEDGQLSMIPWDYNLAFGGFQGGDATSSVNDPIDSPLSVTGSGDRPMADWIFASEEYTERYHQYFAEFLEAVDVAAIIDQAAELIAPYVEKDPTKFCTYEEFQTGTATLREFCLLRQESVESQLKGTIPSTDEGQSADSVSLIDASHITISDMGSMNAGGMDGFGNTGGRGKVTQSDSAEAFDPSAMTFPGGPQSDAAQSGQPEMTIPTGSQMTPPDQAGQTSAPGETGSAPALSDGMELPEGLTGQMPGNMVSGGSSGILTTGSAASASVLLPLAVSAITLLLGLLVAVKYRR